MTTEQRISLQLSECREKLNGLLQKDERTDAEDTELRELTTKAQKLEPEYRAALAVAGGETVTPTGDPEERERREIRSKTGLADFLAAAAAARAVTGAAAEYAAATGCGDFQRVPLALFPDRREVGAITPGPDVDGPVMPHIPFVFEASVAALLGIEMPTVGAGLVQIPRVSTAPPVDSLAKDAAAPATAAAITLDSEAPKRISGQFEIRVEDMAVYPALESVLSETVQDSLGNELDEQIFNGTGAGGDLSGLFKTAANVAAAGAVETYNTGIARFAALVEGKHAYSMADMRAVVGPSTYALYAGLFANNQKGDFSLADYLISKLGLFRVSDRMPAVAASAQKGIVTLTGGPSPVRVYVWNALEIVRDPYSGAGVGKMTLTATALVSDVYIPHGVSMVKEVHPKLS